MSSRGQVEQTGIRRGLKPVSVSVLFGAVITVGILLLLSAVVASRNVPQSAIDPMAIFAVSVGGFASGLICSKIMRENGLLYGTACGIALTVVVLFASLGVSESGFGLQALFKAVFITFSAMIGGVLGVNTKKRRK